MLFIILLFCCWLGILENVSGSFWDIPEKSKHILKLEDNTGFLTYGMHVSMEQSSIGKPLPTNKMCRPRTLKLMSFELKLSYSPYGNCSYCCPITDPKQHIKLYFTNKATGANNTKLTVEQESGKLRSIRVDSSLPTVFYIHGFSNFALDVFARSIRDAYLQRNEDYNIFLVDWSDLSTSLWYWQAVMNLEIVATELASFIRFYDASGELQLSNIHLVGFSLGGQMVGFIGRQLEGRLSRITALDPSYPLFPFNDPSQIVSKNSAQYVDAIHTDAGNLGTYFSVGHADFFPNRGFRPQPGCDLATLAERGLAVHESLTCDHLRSIELYVESIVNPKAFPATKCGVVKSNGKYKRCKFITHGYMGFLAKESKAKGDLYLTTNDRAPFGKTQQEQEPDMETINLIL